MRLLTLAFVIAAVAVGCGSGSDEAAEPLRDGVYQFELTEEYLLENGIVPGQAEHESGVHTTTLDNGEFSDRWESERGETDACYGTYEAEGNRVTFRWTSGCFGDWEMSYSVSGDQVTWDDIEALPPYDVDVDQNITEVFNSVPWTRVGDAPEE